MKLILRSIFALFLICLVVGFLWMYKNNSLHLTYTASDTAKTDKKEKVQNTVQAIPSFNNIDDSYIIHV